MAHPRHRCLLVSIQETSQFSVPFERIQEPIVFGTTKVPRFGIGEKYKHQHHEMLEQLDILDYQSEDDFVVELKTKGQQDRLDSGQAATGRNAR